MNTRISAGHTDITVQVSEIALKNLQLEGLVAELEQALEVSRKDTREEREDRYKVEEKLRNTEYILENVRRLIEEIQRADKGGFSKNHVVAMIGRALSKEHRFNHWMRGPFILNRLPECGCRYCRNTEVRNGSR